MPGWISLHRRIQDHWLWKDKPFDKRSAWIDMLLLANHDDNKFLLGNELIETKKGSFVTSELKLMDRWGWSKTKVRAFLNLLQKDSMIVKISDKKKTTIIIEKYSDYQDMQTTEKPQKNHRETTKEPQKNTNNNVNNIYVSIGAYSENEKLRQALNDFLEMRNEIKSPMTDKAVKLLLSQLDKLGGTDEDLKIALLNQSVLNNWKSIYPLKQDQQQQQPKPQVIKQFTKPTNSFHNFDQKIYKKSESELEEIARKKREKFGMKQEDK